MVSLTANAALTVGAAAQATPTQTFVDYTKVEDMAQTFCTGSGRRFRGSLYGQDNYAYCPICKVTSNHLGAPGITSQLAAEMKLVIPDHVNPVLVAEAKLAVAQTLNAYCPADAVWDIYADATLEVTTTLDCRRPVPDHTIDVALEVTASTEAALGFWTTSTGSGLAVTATPEAVAAWDVHGDTNLLTKATVSVDGPNIWHVNATMPIIATTTA